MTPRDQARAAVGNWAAAWLPLTAATGGVLPNGAISDLPRHVERACEDSAAGAVAAEREAMLSIVFSATKDLLLLLNTPTEQSVALRLCESMQDAIRARSKP